MNNRQKHDTNYDNSIFGISGHPQVTNTEAIKTRYHSPSKRDATEVIQE